MISFRWAIVFVNLVLVVNCQTTEELLPESGRTCPKGTFETGNSCRRCVVGSYSDVENAFQCKPCPSFKTSRPGATSTSACFFCEPGKIFKRTALKGSCRVCPNDTYSAGGQGAIECIGCPSGTVSSRKSGSKESCVTCPPGKVVARQIGGRTSCDRCPTGQSTFATNSDTCSDCPPGTFRSIARSRNHDAVNGSCVKCGPGTFNAKPGAEECALCPVGTFQNEVGALKCKTCPIGSNFPRTGGTVCYPTCMAGTPGCIKCEAGEGLNVETQKCEVCPPGFVSKGLSSTPCVQCVGDEVSANELGTQCVCRPGFRVTRAGMCQQCYGKTNSNGRKCMCDVMGTITGTCSCPPGTKEQENKCIPCVPRGESRCPGCSSGPDKNNCIGCPSGQIFVRAKSECQICPANTTSNGGGQASCLPCPPETTSRPGSVSCACSEGRQLNMTSMKCELCPPGEFSVSGSRVAMYGGKQCQQCPPKTASALAGATQCTRCPRGTGIPDKFGSVSCDVCPFGSSRDDFETKCSCNRGFVNTAPKGEDPVCVRCALNEEVSGRRCICLSRRFGGPNNTTCLPCPRGQVAYEFGRKGCRCPFDVAPVNGVCEKFRCKPGFQPSPGSGGSTDCKPCQLGQVSAGGREFCKGCKKGEEPFDGAKCLAKCPFRTFRNKDEKCQSCQKGQRVVNRVCIDCPNGISRGGDVAVCTPCTDGKIPNFVRSMCVEQ